MKCNECPVKDSLMRLERLLLCTVSSSDESGFLGLARDEAARAVKALSTLPADEAQREAEADADIAAGRVSGPMTAEEAIARLHKHDTGEWAKDREVCERWKTLRSWHAGEAEEYGQCAVSARIRWGKALDEIARLRALLDGKEGGR